MARQRMIKPEIWASEQVHAMSDFQFRVYVGLVSAADDEGRLKANPALIASFIFPLSEDLTISIQVREAIIQIENIKDASDGSPLIGLYQIGKVPYIYHPKWHNHQRIPKSTKSINCLPEPLPKAQYESNRHKVTAFGYRLLEHTDESTATGTSAGNATGNAAAP